MSRWPSYRLVRTPPPPVPVPDLDPSQQAVVDHPGGPLLVLAGPGTGKTTTLVEAVVERVRRGASPEQVLVLTFSRKAADELRERISGRLGRTVSAPSAWTFHAWCYALVCAYDSAPDRAAPRLLSGPERLVRIRELLAGAVAGQGSTDWPAAMAGALPTRGFARELADLLDRARERGLEPADLRALGTETARAEWRAAADFFDEYVAVLGAREMDYGELVRRALRTLDDPAVLAEVRGRYAAVFVDEYQDADPAQEELLAALADRGGDLVVVGDPDQSIYAFRGADVSCLLGFPDRFPTVAGRPAPTTALQVSRRAGSGLLRHSRAVTARIPTPGLDTARRAEHRALTAAPGRPEGSAEVRLFSTAAAEATAIADLLRRAHLRDGLPWEEMAVLVRSGVRSLPVLRRALVAAGVPVAVAADELPVARDPAVAPLLLALRCAADPAALTTEAVRLLLTSPLGRASPSDLRRLGRALRVAERAAYGAPEGDVTLTDGTPGAGGPHPEVDQPAVLRLPHPSAVLLREAVADTRELVLIDDRTAEPARRVAALVGRAAEILAAGGAAEEALWAIWDGSRWPHRLARESLTGGQPGRAADRDLDAVVALFEALARLEERQPRAGVAVLLDELESQEIPSSSRAEGSLATGAVRLLTAHRAKGLEWHLVVVAAVQDGSWPDLRRRGSLLEADRLSRQGVLPGPTAASLLTDERRLFYVAVTRARERLVLTAVQSEDDAGERPSRFLTELDLPLPPVTEAAPPLLSMHSLVGRLRRATLDGDRPESGRQAAVAELARLAGPGADGRPRVAVAHPDSWWGMVGDTPGVAPVRPRDEPVALSGSAVSGYATCPLAWFLDREARAKAASTTAQGFGLVLHVLFRLVGEGRLSAELDPLLERLDQVWGSLGFSARWERDRERREAARALAGFLLWSAANPRRQLASEAAVDVVVAGARLRGSIDRLDQDAGGRLHVVDFKTAGQKPSMAAVQADPQLAIYQIAVRECGVQGIPEGELPVLGGAELVQLRDRLAGDRPAVQEQDPLVVEGTGGSWADELLARTVAGVLAEQFPARRNERCERCPFRRCCPAHAAGAQVVS